MQEHKCYERSKISSWACKDVNELYQKIMKVGSGTYGEVNKASLKSDPSQIVALKKIKDETETEGFPITALREISILQKLDHPNIVRLLDIVTSKVSDNAYKKNRGSTYLVFEYMEHELLGLIETCNFAPSQVKCIIKQVLEGLAHIHEKNIIHRDIKSANILINNRGEVKIADFGLAKNFIPTMSGKLTQRVVTRWYRAPELLLGSRKYTTQIDIWAVGCVFAELLIGRSDALFPAQKTPDQFEIICKKIGTPNEDEWPGFMSLPFYSSMIPGKHSPELMKYMRSQKSNIEPAALDLLERMLTMNPERRITAKQALQHEYFTTEPLPCDKSEMPKIEKECHAHLLNEQRIAARQQQQEQQRNEQRDKDGNYGKNQNYQKHSGHQNGYANHYEKSNDSKYPPKNLSNSKSFEKNEKSAEKNPVIVVDDKGRDKQRPGEKPRSFLATLEKELSMEEKKPEKSLAKKDSKSNNLDGTDHDNLQKRKSGLDLDEFETAKQKKSHENPK